MWKTYLSVAVTMVAALVALSVISGCGGGSSAGAGGLQVFLSDTPLAAKAVNVTVSRIDVSRTGSGWVTLRDFTANPPTINLLDYRYDGNTNTPDRYLLSDTPLTPGHYTQIRLILNKVEVVDMSDVTHECAMSSQDKTGIKLIGEFDVAANTKSAVLIDFDVAKSIVVEGNGMYRLKPTMRCVPLQISGTVYGVVQFRDKDASPEAVPPGAAIGAYQGGTSIASTLIESDGKFGIMGLVAGDYVLKLETPEYTAPDTPVTITAMGATDAGTIIATDSE